MKLETRLLGSVDYEEEDILSFPNGIPSFEEEHSFLLLPIAECDGNMYSLQSTGTPELAFILMDPFSLFPAYAPVLQAAERKALAVDADEELGFYVLCALKRPVSSSTVNLKCPIAINPKTRTCMQIILDSDAYQMHHTLSEFYGAKEDASC